MMGTSKSSEGSPSNVPMVPPWVLDSEIDGQQQPTQHSNGSDSKTPQTSEGATVPIAPKGRFRSTRTSLGEFGVSGRTESIRRGVGRYISSGLGGSVIATRRFGATAKTAGLLYGVLGGTDTDSSILIDQAILEGKSARVVIDTVIETICPVDGTQDTESSRDSINDALSELLQRHPETNISDLSEDQREFIVEAYVSMDVYRRFVLDVGNAIREKAPNPSTALSRLKQAREYIREHIVASFRKLRGRGVRLSGNRVTRIVSIALQEAFDVFSGYAE